MRKKNHEFLLEYLRNILYNNPIDTFDIDEVEELYRDLGQDLQVLQREVASLRKYASELSKGNLSVEFPSENNLLCNDLKEIHESMNRFSKEAYKDEEVIEGYNKLLEEMTNRRNEWLLIVDRDSHKTLYCNKRKQQGAEAQDFCQACKERLPFWNEILTWSADQQYKVWESGDEEDIHYHITSFPVVWRGRPSYGHVVLDVTNEMREERDLTNKAYHDPGTGVKNRLYFEEYLKNVMKEKRSVTISYMDLDGLKYVNDKFGHQEGDAYIRNFVAAVQHGFRNNDIFARVGGDEFCLLLEGSFYDLVNRKMQEILRKFQEENTKEYAVSFSYGIVEIKGEENTLSMREIYKQADALMYECKRRNKKEHPELIR